MSALPPNLAHNAAIWGILDPVLDTPRGAKDGNGNVIVEPSPERVAAAQQLMQYLVDERLLFSITKKAADRAASRYPENDSRVSGRRWIDGPAADVSTPQNDLRVLLSMCTVRIAEFVLYNLTRETVSAAEIDAGIRPTLGLLTNVAVLGSMKDFTREHRDLLTGRSVTARRHSEAVQQLEALRNELGREPSRAELTAHLAKNADPDAIPSETVTVADLYEPPGSVSFEDFLHGNGDESAALDLPDEHAENRADAAIAIGLLSRAIRMWAPTDPDEQQLMRRYVNAWIAIRVAPDAPEIVSVYSIIQISKLPRRTATRLAKAFNEQILPAVRENVVPAQAQASVQRHHLVDSVEAAVRRWAPEQVEQQAAMRSYTNAWFYAARKRHSLKPEDLASRIRRPVGEARVLGAAFEQHILPAVELVRAS